MSHPPVQQVEGLGETFSKVVGGISETLQTIAQQRQQQQTDALKQLLMSTQMQSEEALTEQRKAQTAKERADLAAQQKKDRETQLDNDELQGAMGKVLAGYTQGGGKLDSPEFTAAVGRAVQGIKRPGAGTAFATQYHDFITNLTAAPKAQAELERQVAEGHKAITDAAVAAAQAPGKTAEGRALDTWHRQHPGTPLDVGLIQLRDSLERQRQAAGDDKQAEMSRRQLVVGALAAARAAKRQDDQTETDVTKQRPLSSYLAEQAGALTDPITGKPMDGATLAREAGRMVRGIPNVPAATGNVRTDAATMRRLLPALRRAGYDDAGAKEFFRSNGYQ